MITNYVCEPINWIVPKVATEKTPDKLVDYSHIQIISSSLFSAACVYFLPLSSWRALSFFDCLLCGAWYSVYAHDKSF